MNALTNKNQSDEKEFINNSMKNLKRVHIGPKGGRRGSINATIKELNSLFGKFTDNSNSSDGKVTTVWNFQDGNNIYSIYDYKETSLYSSSCPSLEDFRLNHNQAIEWGVGANCNADVFIEYVTRKLENHRNLTRKEKKPTENSGIRNGFYGIGDHLGRLKIQNDVEADGNLKLLVTNLETCHEKLRKYLDENYKWD